MSQSDFFIDMNVSVWRAYSVANNLANASSLAAADNADGIDDAYAFFFTLSLPIIHTLHKIESLWGVNPSISHLTNCRFEHLISSLFAQRNLKPLSETHFPYTYYFGAITRCTNPTFV